MKINFKYVSMLACAALMAGFTSCSDNEIVSNNPEGPETPGTEETLDDLLIQVTIPETKGTRAESPTNVGIYPHVFDLTLVFVGPETTGAPDKILRVIEGNVSALTGAGQRFKGLPLGTNGLYVIGNTKDTYAGTAHAATISGYNAATLPTFGKLSYPGGKTSLMDYDPATNGGNYTDVTTFMKDVRLSLDSLNLTDAKAVNVTGYAPIAATQGTTPVSVLVTPAISRYEISKIMSKQITRKVPDYTATPNDGSVKKDTVFTPTFQVKGIYISNTMKEISVDGKVYPTEPHLLLNYGWNSPEWNVSLMNWKHSDVNTNWGLVTTPLFDREPLNPRTVDGDGTKYYEWATPYASSRTSRYTAADADYGYDNKIKTWGAWAEHQTYFGTSDSIFTPTPGNPEKFWSFYIASARKQQNPNQVISNPYLDDENYNRIGLECGIWPYQDELNYVNDGAGVRANVAGSTKYNDASDPTITNLTTMKVDDPNFINTGKGIAFGTFPTVVIEVELDKPNASGLKRGFLTITKFLDADNNNVALKYPKPGTVYKIKTIAFDADLNLTPDPQWPDTNTDISVNVVVQGWVGQNTNVEF